MALEGLSEELRQDFRTVVDALDAAQELSGARINLEGAQRDAVVTAYQPLTQIGRMTAVDLALPVTVHDPLEHYRATRTRWRGTGPALPNRAEED